MGHEIRMKYPYVTCRLPHGVLEKRRKLLVYHRLKEAHQKLLDESRLKERTNYLKLGAVKVISRAEADELRSAGAGSLPTQWIDADKNKFLRNESNPNIEPRMKSRLVACGDLSMVFNRSDSPTAEKEGMFLKVSKGLLGCEEALWSKKLEINHFSQILTKERQILVLSVVI